MIWFRRKENKMAKEFWFRRNNRYGQNKLTHYWNSLNYLAYLDSRISDIPIWAPGGWWRRTNRQKMKDTGWSLSHMILPPAKNCSKIQLCSWCILCSTCKSLLWDVWVLGRYRIIDYSHPVKEGLKQSLKSPDKQLTPPQS